MQGKVAKDAKEAWEIQSRPQGPQAWIQWKATNVFMDAGCKCGASFNISGPFAYNIECPSCGTIYMCNGHIELIEILNPDKSEATILGE